MFLITKQVKGHDYYYLVEKARRDGRVVTSRTVYIGDRRKLSALIQGSAAGAFPTAFESEHEVGAALALTIVAKDLGIEELIDEVCPVRSGAVRTGGRVVAAAIHRALAPRGENSKRRLSQSHGGESALGEFLDLPAGALDNRRLCEALEGISSTQIDRIEAGIVRRLIEKESVSLNALAFDCSNFDSYAGAKTTSLLLRRGHAKSGRPLRIMGLGMLVTEDDGIPLLTFVYPGNENDVTAFARFLDKLDQRRTALGLPIDATVAADGGNISRQLLLRLEKDARHHVMRIPAKHAGNLVRGKSSELSPMRGSLKGKIRARKQVCSVYKVDRCLVDVYSRRMHERQLPGLQRDRERARAELVHLQSMLERQRKGLRRAKPLTAAILKRRVAIALAREHMRSLFEIRIDKDLRGPILHVEESATAWQHLNDYVLGRTLLVTDRSDWAPEQIILASRKQSHDERAFRDLKDPGGVSMLPLRHRKDSALRAHALVVVIGLMLVRILQRRIKRAGVKAPSVASVLGPLKGVHRGKLQYGSDAPPALRALAKTTWVRSARTPRQQEILVALGIDQRAELGTTVHSVLGRAGARSSTKSPKETGNSR